MVTVDEELEAAKQAQTVISALLISSAADPNIVAALRKVKDVAVQSISIFPSHAAAAGGAGASGLAGIKSGLAAMRNFGLAEVRFGSWAAVQPKGAEGPQHLSNRN
jgi:hypothetical protein